MRRSFIIITIAVLCSLVSCSHRSDKNRREVDSLCIEAQRVRYSDVERSADFLDEALCKVGSYDNGRARILNRQAFLKYQQMDYDEALTVLDTVRDLTNNHITLLCGDVMRMKITQRTGDGRGFYEARTSALRHLDRVGDDLSYVSKVDSADYLYAKTEFHIISSTYYYYQEQDSLSKAEMRCMATDISLAADTAQWLNYHYMMGSGGLVDGDYAEIVVQEFEHLMQCYSVARSHDNLYFLANALQAFSSRLKTATDRSIVSKRFPDAYALLYGQHLSWMPDSTMPSDSLLPLALANHALHTFKLYGDRFQTACVYRTLGELYSYNSDFDKALESITKALHLVNEHHRLYYPESADSLMSFNPEDTLCVPVEVKWIEDEKVSTVPEWMLGIRHQLSLVYSALGMKRASDYNRNIYLDILHCTSPNREMESRKMELEEENRTQFQLLLVSAFLFLLLLSMVGVAFYRMKWHVLGTSTKDRARVLRSDKQKLELLSDQLEETEEQCLVSANRIETNKLKNSERRAKVSLVQAVVPFLDRIINEVNRMNRKCVGEQFGAGNSGKLTSQLEYVSELAGKIVDYNDILTEWIKMEHGQLSLQISSVQLSDVFSILEQGHFAFDQKGVKLNVVPTTACVKADEALTLFMLNTLADNARKFTPSGGSVTIEALENENYVELSVSDTGCGMSESDIDTILNNKVYDAQSIGTDKSSKGFGFGIMNCKGIIEKYKKTSALFGICLFGIESAVGKGSRFYFRLPRVMALLCAFILSVTGWSQANDCSEEIVSSDSLFRDAVYYYDRTYNANVNGDYQQAVSFADSALCAISPDFVVYEDGMSSQSSDIRYFKSGADIDFQLLVLIRNEIAVAALALNDWDVYRYNNKICIYLYKHLNQDSSLPTYCEELARAESASRQTTVLLVVLIFVLVVATVFILRGRKRMFAKLSLDIQDKLNEAKDRLSHLRYEENRLYVQNQVLDNCLSTIKHESMYFPSRIQQLVGRMISSGVCQNKETSLHGDELSASFEEDLHQLTELTHYYKKLYSLLTGQAERQVAQLSFRREVISLEQLLDLANREYRKQARRHSTDARLSVVVDHSAEGFSVHGDTVLLNELFKQLFDYLLHLNTAGQECVLKAVRVGENLQLKLSAEFIHLTEDEAHNMFYPDKKRIGLLVVKQIIRDIDELNNNPGLRLVAEQNTIWFTLK